MKNKLSIFSICLFCFFIFSNCSEKMTCPLCNGTNVVVGSGQSMKCPICKNGKITEKQLKKITKPDMPCGFCGGTGFGFGGGICTFCMGRGKTSFLDFNRSLFGQTPSSSHSHNPFEGRDFSKCPICHGTGRCDYCAGRGWKLYDDGTPYDCSFCHGTGKCQTCYGSGEFTR